MSIKLTLGGQTPLRATAEEETQGLDLRQHGEQIN